VLTATVSRRVSGCIVVGAEDWPSFCKSLNKQERTMRITSTIITSVVLAICMTGLSGCGAKKEKAGQAPAQKAPAQQAVQAQQQKGQAQQQKGQAVVASPRDEADAAPLKERVLAQYKAGDYAAIYREASTGFRAVGPETQFIALWAKQHQETGAFKDAKEVSHTVRPQDKFLIYIYHVQYANKKKQLRLTFGRSNKGKMELTGINQTEIK
jgi:hypothetical protein